MTSSTRDFNWSTCEQTLAKFTETAHLPAVILVTAGHHGDSEWESLSSQEIIRVHCKSTWKRVLARDSSGHGYSIPVDYPVPFKQLQPKAKSSQRLQSLLQKAKYPIQIRVAPEAGVKFNVLREKRRIFDFGCLTVNSANDIYEETFLKGNGFKEGRLNETIIVVPSYVNIRVVEAVGSRKPGLEKKLASQASSLNYKGATPHMDISRFSEEKLSSCQDVYASIEPDEYITYVSLQKTLQAESDNPYTAMVRPSAPPPTTKATSIRGRDADSIPTKATQSRSRDAESISSGKQRQRKMSEPGPQGHPMVIAQLQQRHRPLPPTPPEPGHADLPSKGSANVYVLPPSSSSQLPARSPTEAVAARHRPPATRAENEWEVDSSRDVYATPPLCKYFSSFEEIPRDLSSLTVQQVSDCLRLLRIPRYVGVFTENMIDGTLLVDLDKEMMLNELRMKPLDANKLHHFIHHKWKPKLDKR